MRRNLILKREVLTALSSDELRQVAGGTGFSCIICISGDVCIGHSDVCFTETCLTDVDCYKITMYCTLGAIC